MGEQNGYRTAIMLRISTGAQVQMLRIYRRQSSCTREPSRAAASKQHQAGRQVALQLDASTSKSLNSITVRERGRERERELGGIGPLHFKTLVRSTARAGPAAAVQIDDATAAIATRAKNCSRPQMGQDKNPRTHLRTASRL